MAAPKHERKRARPEVEDAVAAALEDQEPGATQTTKRARVESRKSLFVRSLPPAATSESLTDFFSQHFPVKHAVVVLDHKTKESRGYGFVTFADAEDATEAQKALDKAEWDGRHIRVDLAEPRHRTAADDSGKISSAKPGKPVFQPPSKLIVRNLPWSIKTSEQLSHLFRSFGKVRFADLPNSNGKLKGFGFVTIRGRANAEKALKAVNGKEIDGRTLAVDWAVDKATWEKQKDQDEANVEDAESADGGDASKAGDAAKDVNRDTELQGLNADVENFMKNHLQNLEDESEDEEDEDETMDAVKDERPPRKTTDNSSTIFIRNLPFTTTDEQLRDFFSGFGSVRYARVVMNKATDKPAGTGFVCFFNQSDAKECLKGAPRPRPSATGVKQSLLLDESADPSGKYTLEGRLLHVAQAVNKEEATQLAENSFSSLRERDKRRLYLLSEGAVGPGTSLYDVLSPVEVQMRQASAAQRKKLVKSNPSLHLSLTRLAIRNMPRSLGSKELKELARKAIVGFAKDVKEGRRRPLSKEENARDDKDVKEKERGRRHKGKGIVRQAKVVFESNQGSKVSERSGAGKSRGYGFIEYTSHHWALMGLRYLNGHQVLGDNGKKQRLIVEFAIENAQVVQRRRAAEEKLARTGHVKSKEVQVEVDSVDSDDGSDDAAQDKNQRGGNAKRSKAGKVREGEDGEAGANKTEAMTQKLIARKRLMRKKKAKARGKGKS